MDDAGAAVTADSEIVLCSGERGVLLPLVAGTEAVSMMRVVTFCSAGVCEVEMLLCSVGSLVDCDGGGIVVVISGFGEGGKELLRYAELGRDSKMIIFEVT